MPHVYCVSNAVCIDNNKRNKNCMDIKCIYVTTSSQLSGLKSLSCARW